MKRFLARAGTKIGRFFWSWGFLKFVLWTITLIVFLYVEEDWRGARAWAATKAKWEAKGETFDLNRFTPPPIPDELNVGALPIFQLQKVPGNGGPYLDDVALRNAFGHVNFSDFHSTNGWMWNQLPDLEKIRAGVFSQYITVFKQTPPSNDPLVQLDALYPFLDNFRAAASSRPYCRFPFDDTPAMPADRSLGPITGQIALCRILTLHAILAIDRHQSDLALEDFQTILKLRLGVQRDPSLVGGLVGIGLFSIGNAIVSEGLALHAWSDTQLTKLERLLLPIDSLAVFQFDMKSEAAVSAGNLDFLKRDRRPDVIPLLLGMSRPPPPDVSLLSSWFLSGYSFLDAHWRGGYAVWPAGWFDEDKVRVVDSILRVSEDVDDRVLRVYPALGEKLNKESSRVAKSEMGWAPWNLFSTAMISSFENTSSKFALDQVRVDETRIACALERYHLAHGIYPGSLDALIPACIDAVPHDIMNGQPYHYQLRDNGMFLLYSVGWNQTDDGGVAIYTDSNHHPSQDYEHGDWVWPTPK